MIIDEFDASITEIEKSNFTQLIQLNQKIKKLKYTKMTYLLMWLLLSLYFFRQWLILRLEIHLERLYYISFCLLRFYAVHPWRVFAWVVLAMIHHLVYPSFHKAVVLWPYVHVTLVVALGFGHCFGQPEFHLFFVRIWDYRGVATWGCFQLLNLRLELIYSGLLLLIYFFISLAIWAILLLCPIAGGGSRFLLCVGFIF